LLRIQITIGAYTRTKFEYSPTLNSWLLTSSGGVKMTVILLSKIVASRSSRSLRSSSTMRE
jgi:hypothetical protein